MDKTLTLGILLTAKDAFSPVFSSFKSSLGNMTKSSKDFSTAIAGIGTGLKGVQLATQGGAQEVIKSFVDLEEAQTQLKNTLMKSDGSVSPFFKSINQEAITLGNKLPGTTADFLQMAASMKALGVEEQSIVKGGLKSAAYLGAVLKIPYQEAAEATAKFKQAMGIADAELLPFIDDIQRLSHMGVKVGEMSFAFSKIGATMKGLGMSGLKAARDIEPLIGLLIKSGFSGETVGTNLGNIIEKAVGFSGNKDLSAMGIKLNFNDEKGKFKGTENMIKEMEKLKAIKSDSARLGIMQAIFGSGEGSTMANVLINEGAEGVARFNRNMAVQADINKRAAASGATLGAMWEAMTGTFTNFLALVGESFAPEMKSLTGAFSDIAGGLSAMSEKHPMFAKFIGAIVIGVPVVAGVLGTLGIAVGALTTSLGFLGITSMLAFGWVIGGVALVAGAAYLIVSNWGPIKGFFSGLWGGIQSIAMSTWGVLKTLFGWTPLGMIVNNWIPIVGVFKSIIGMITKPFGEFFAWIESKFNFVSNKIQGIGSFFGISGPAPIPTQALGVKSPVANNRINGIANSTNPRIAAVRAVPSRSAANTSVTVNISNPNFASKEHAAATQKQLDEQVRKALARHSNDKKDRSYS